MGPSSAWEPPEADSCVSLYRRAYGGYCDAIFPPAFIQLFAIICAYKLLPWWAILLALPLTFMAGVQLILIKGALSLFNNLLLAVFAMTS